MQFGINKCKRIKQIFQKLRKLNEPEGECNMKFLKNFAINFKLHDNNYMITFSKAILK